VGDSSGENERELAQKGAASVESAADPNRWQLALGL
jgi:hypothetical protein